jgi:soluble lytic murein transglycosylase-like protein
MEKAMKKRVLLTSGMALFLSLSLAALPRFPSAYGSVVLREAEANDVPLQVIYVLFAHESGWNQQALCFNSNGTFDVGIAQLNSGYFGYFGEQFWGEGFDPYNPEHNISVGIRYLARLYRYTGHWLAAMLAYNVGPTAWARRAYSDRPLRVATTLYQRALVLQAGRAPKLCL